MRFAFRVDASVEIGSGHVMRCLTLAHRLREAGGTVVFLSRELPGHLNDAIATQGFQVHRLPAPESDEANAEGPAHARWLGVDWQRDARECAAVLAERAPDWLVVDHYALDAQWQEAVLPPGSRLMVIDDIADRPHRADLLLDQNLGRRPEDYDALLPEDCTRLIGPRFALLRPEFAAARPAALARRRAAGRIGNILVFMGGMDKDNATGAVLDALSTASLPEDAHVTVLLGGRAPFLEQVRAQCADLPFSVELRVDETDMAGVMTRADVAIGAAGSTSWERCCLGLPGIVVEIAENQSEIARALVAAGAALEPGRLQSPCFAQRLQEALAGFRDPSRLAAFSENAAQICDGEGAARVDATLRP